ncbi:MAG: hypothetical protein ABIG71_02965 [Candidatus Uhrbacteria bacterium]
MARINRPYIPQPQHGAVERTQGARLPEKHDAKNERWEQTMASRSARDTTIEQHEERKRSRERRMQLEEAIAALQPGDCFVLIANDKQTKAFYVFVGRRADRIRVAALNATGCQRIAEEQCPPHIGLRVDMIVSGYDHLEVLVANR